MFIDNRQHSEYDPNGVERIQRNFFYKHATPSGYKNKRNNESEEFKMFIKYIHRE